MSTLHASERTHRQVLPQPAALEPAPADNPRGSYARTRSDAYGFPRLPMTRQKRHFGFQTGDHVRATVLAGKKAGTYAGRVAVRASRYFNITTTVATVQGISHRHCTLIARADGWAYAKEPETGMEDERSEAGSAP